MRRNEPNADERIVGPIPFYDNAGQLKTGLTFAGAGETRIWNLDTGTFTDTASDAVEIPGTGLYYVPLSQAESDHPSFIVVELVKATYATQYYTMPIDARSTDITAMLARLLGLHRENSVMDGGAGIDKVQYEAGIAIQSRVRVFASKAEAEDAVFGAPDDDDGEIARYLTSATVDGTMAATFTLVRDA